MRAVDKKFIKKISEKFKEYHKLFGFPAEDIEASFEKLSKNHEV